jgi:hypothetical protein
MATLVGALPRAEPVPDGIPVQEPETEEPMLTIGILSAHPLAVEAALRHATALAAELAMPGAEGQVAVFDTDGDALAHFFMDDEGRPTDT